MYKEIEVLFFLKFINKDHQEMFLDGDLFMRNLQFFVDSEKDEKGMGDKNEGALIYNSAIAEVGNIKLEGVKNISIRLDRVAKIPILCLFMIKKDMIKRDSDNHSEGFIHIENSVLEHMKKHFGDNVLLIEARTFLERVEKACKSQGINYCHSYVRYFDYTKDDKERFEFIKYPDDPKILFAKDNFFEKQNEYRFIFPNEIVDMTKDIPNFTLKIGDIRDIAANMSVDEIMKRKVVNL